VVEALNGLLDVLVLWIFKIFAVRRAPRGFSSTFFGGTGWVDIIVFGRRF